jgi:hypothetical protein
MSLLVALGVLTRITEPVTGRTIFSSGENQVIRKGFILYVQSPINFDEPPVVADSIAESERDPASWTRVQLSGATRIDGPQYPSTNIA